MCCMSLSLGYSYCFGFVYVEGLCTVYTYIVIRGTVHCATVSGSSERSLAEEGSTHVNVSLWTSDGWLA
jgi:hypothetical protein